MKCTHCGKEISFAHGNQVGGTHYSQGDLPQHWDLAIMYRWDPFQYQITKYVMRWKDKYDTDEKRLEDLKKARSFLDKYIANYQAFLGHTLVKISGSEVSLTPITPLTTKEIIHDRSGISPAGDVRQERREGQGPQGKDDGLGGTRMGRSQLQAQRAERPDDTAPCEEPVPDPN